MGVGRLIPVSLGLAVLFTLTGVLFVFLDDQFEGVPDVIWYLLFFIIVFALMLLAININITKRVRRIQKGINESGVDTMNGLTRTMTLDKLEEAIGEWTAKQARVVEELESREEFRREYMGNVSHELKTPIFNIQGYILTLLDGAKDDPKIAAVVMFDEPHPNHYGGTVAAPVFREMLESSLKYLEARQHNQ